ncbi:MAG TPA: nuclear transport factor 2 family protein [Pyrinomonadaceae bacterium]|nr:nuclear transport factor 2 family protein [Pyrinomonadaceae bacterium]
MKLKSIFFAFIILLFVSHAFAQTKDEAELTKLVNKMVAAQMNYDAAALDAVFTADYIEISPVGEFDPRAKVLGFYKPELKPDPAKVSTKSDASEWSIRVRDKSAVVILRLDYTITAEGKTMPPRGMRVMLVCVKEKGVWKIASAQYTGIRPPQPPKPAQ